jgi:tetratricopeptide (TPR) repeat protein
MQAGIDSLREHGRQAYERKEYAEALEYYRLIIADHPGFADVRHAAGLCLSFLGQPAAAIEEFEAALEINPTYIEAMVNRALVLHELGRYDEARRSFEEASRLEKHREGRFSVAAAAKLANAHAAVGDLYMDAAAPAEASVQYRTALELQPGFHDIRNKLAAALLALDWPQEAANELHLALQGNPRFVAARLNLGLAYFRMGRPADAVAEWRAAGEIEPDHPQVRAYLSLIESGDVESVDPNAFPH